MPAHHSQIRIEKWQSATAENEVFRELLVARIGALAGAPFIAQLCYYTILALAIFQPFKKPRIHTA